jgi:hypothetical protein
LIFFIADGKLGNQIFQYVFLKGIQKHNESIFVARCDELKDVFELDQIKVINSRNRLVNSFFLRIATPVFNFLSDKKIISSISVKQERVLEFFTRESTTYTKTKGILSFFTFLKLGFFQSELFFQKDFAEKLLIKEKFQAQADEFLNRVPQNSHRVFVHFRRGDYKDFTVYGKNTLLPISYFKDQIDWFLKNRVNSFFVFLSDEPKLVENEFGYLENKIISSNNSYGTDMAIMTKCNSAILSPSSFGWWGAYLMNNRDTVFAPEFWLGFNSGCEFQGKCITEFMTKVRV